MNKYIIHQNSKWPHTAAIFCGFSEAQRFTSPRHMMRLPNGLTLIEHLYQILAFVCRHVVIVGECDFIPPRLMNSVRVPINFTNKGPIGGLEALLSSGLDTEYLISPCDIGLVDTKIFQLLTQTHIKPPAILAYPQVNSPSNNIPQAIDIVDQPLIGRYSAESLMLVREQIIRHELSMDRLAHQADAVKLVIPEDMIYVLHGDTSIYKQNMDYQLN